MADFYQSKTTISKLGNDFRHSSTTSNGNTAGPAPKLCIRPVDGHICRYGYKSLMASATLLFKGWVHVRVTRRQYMLRIGLVMLQGARHAHLKALNSVAEELQLEY